MAGRAAFLVLALTALGACAPELDWRELKSDEGRFTTAMPARLRYETQPLAGAAGVTMHLWSAQAADSVFGVGYADHSGADPDLVERTAAGLARNISGRITQRRDIKLGERAAGLEFTAEAFTAEGDAPERLLQARVLRAGERLYQQVVISPRGRLAPADLELFFSSFRLLP